TAQSRKIGAPESGSGKAFSKSTWSGKPPQTRPTGPPDKVDPKNNHPRGGCGHARGRGGHDANARGNGTWFILPPWSGRGFCGDVVQIRFRVAVALPQIMEGQGV